MWPTFLTWHFYFPPLIILVWFSCFSLLFFPRWNCFISLLSKRKFLSSRLTLLSMGDGESPGDRFPYWCLARKFQTGWLILCFWKRLKMHLDRVLFGITGFYLAQVMPFWAYGFLFNKYIHTYIFLNNLRASCINHILLFRNIAVCIS